MLPPNLPPVPNQPQGHTPRYPPQPQQQPQYPQQYQQYQPQQGVVPPQQFQHPQFQQPPGPGPQQYQQPQPQYGYPQPQGQVPVQQVPPLPVPPTQIPPRAPIYPNQQPLQQPIQNQPQAQAYYNNVNHGAGDQLSAQLGGLSVTQQGFNRMWGSDSLDLLKCRGVLPPTGVKPPEVRHSNEFFRDKNASPELFRCTLTKIPETKTLLQKSRLPLGILIHPFKDLTQLPVVQCSTIVRCRSCRTYINPFVYFIDNRRWKCNLCFRVNDLPDEFQFDPLTKTYGEPHRRPEILSGTIEFLAPADYMVRPPQAAVYLFVLEVSAAALESGYLKIVCDAMLENLHNLPGDTRTQLGFITYSNSVHFFDMSGDNPRMLCVPDVEDVFLPLPDGLLVRLDEAEECIRTLLTLLPSMFNAPPVSGPVGTCLGPALQSAQKMLSTIGGRITIFSHTLPTLGVGAVQPRGSASVNNLTKDLNPSTDFYKKVALDCSGQYIAVDLFFTGNTYQDIASIACVAKYSGGCIYRVHQLENPNRRSLLESCFTRYITRKIGFESVMRVRCSRGMSIHTFHGNLFVRSTDLLSLPNCNPDAGFGMQVAIDEDLRDFQHVAFQAALLYTSSKGERRIRVHTLCLPVASNINDVILSADQQCIVGLLAKMGVDRVLSTSITDAREAFLNAVVDILSAYLTTQNGVPGLGLLVPSNILQMLPGYIHGLLRGIGFRTDMKPTLDDRSHFFNQLKTLPLSQMIQMIYPDLYRIDTVMQTPLLEHESPEDDQQYETSLEIPNFPLLSLGSDKIDANGVYLLDTPEQILVYVNRNVHREFCEDVLNCQGFSFFNEMNSFPELDNVASQRVRNFVSYLQSLKPYAVPVRLIREDSRERPIFTSQLVEDRGEASPSYYEFLQQVKNLVK